MTDKTRTLTQNSALHLYYKLLADALNSGGFEMVKTLEVIFSAPVEVWWTPELVKEHLWRPIQKVATLDKHSTVELTTSEVSEVYRLMDRHIAQTTGVSVSFPSYRHGP